MSRHVISVNAQGFSKSKTVFHGQSICQGCQKPCKFLRPRNKKLHLCSVCMDKLDRQKEVKHESDNVGAASQPN